MKRKGRMFDHMQKVCKIAHDQQNKEPIPVPKTDGDQAAASSSQPKRRKVDDGAYFT